MARCFLQHGPHLTSGTTTKLTTIRTYRQPSQQIGDTNPKNRLSRRPSGRSGRRELCVVSPPASGSPPCPRQRTPLRRLGPSDARPLAAPSVPASCLAPARSIPFMSQTQRRPTERPLVFVAGARGLCSNRDCEINDSNATNMTSLSANLRLNRRKFCNLQDYATGTFLFINAHISLV